MLLPHFKVAAIMACITALASSQVQLVNMTAAATSKGLSATCIGVINQQVQCNSTLKWAGRPGKFETDATLNGLCSPTCATSLATWLRRITQACTTRLQRDDGYDVHPAYYAQLFIEKYNLVCLQSPSGQNCNQNLRNVFKINPINQQQTGTPVAGAQCTNCALQYLQTQMMMPLASSPALSSTFVAMTSACSRTNYTVTPIATTTQWSTLRDGVSVTTTTTTTSAATTPTCEGALYTVKSGDTCYTISKAQGISTSDLLMTNNLPPLCLKFPASGTLCIPTLSKCTLYKTRTGDTCASVATVSKVTWTQIVSWNPVLGISCQNLPKYIGYEVCVSNPRGTWINPFPDLPVTATPTTTKELVFTVPLTPMNAFPTAVFQSVNETLAIANGTRLDCSLLVAGEEIVDQATNTVISSCTQVAAGYNITEADLKLWNPTLALANPCILQPKLQYCVQLLPLIPPNSTSYCLQHDVAPPGYSCFDFTISKAIHPDQFAEWNPSVGKNCTNWKTGLNYCTAVYHFKQSGIIGNCNKWAIANVTDRFRNPCGILETQFGLTHGRFVAWNPAVGTSCKGLTRNYDYCVSVPNFTPIFATPSPLTRRADPTLVDVTTTLDSGRSLETSL